VVKDKNISGSRRDAIQKILRTSGFLGIGGMLWGAYASETKKDELALRPPGAIPQKDFIKACIKCGICVETCPYDTLKLAEPGESPMVGTPWFSPRDIPCYMCPDIPCVPDCPSGALDILRVSTPDSETGEEIPDIRKAEMGVAIIDTDSCIAYWGIQCDACYRACPLIDEAISLEYKRNERTGKHALLQPVIHKDICTGCGICEHVCVTEKAAIMIFPEEKVSGEVGDHYIRGWEKNDEDRLKDWTDIKEKAEDDEIQDYLNNWEELIDE